MISGMRGDCDVRIYVDLAAAVADGFAFFESANGVVLCAGDKRGLLPPRYFRRAVHKKRGRTEQGARVDLSGWRMNLAHLFLGYPPSWLTSDFRYSENEQHSAQNLSRTNCDFSSFCHFLTKITAPSKISAFW